MSKYIILFVLLWVWVGFVSSKVSSYTPISKQIDLKTMSLKKPDYIYKRWSECKWTCINYSSSSSYGWGSYGWK